jgi:hypothetical protein
MQETKKFKAADGKTISVVVDSCPGNKKGALMIHGFTGGVMMHAFQCAAKTFPHHGMDTWRIFLYSTDENCRLMDDTTWDQNMSDIGIVLNEMQAAYPETYLIGHSLEGAQSVYAATEKTKGLALWEPACAVTLGCCKDSAFSQRHYEVNWGCTILASKSYVDSCRKVGRYAHPISHKKPTLVMLADETKEQWPSDIVPAKVCRVNNCDHCFNNEGNMEILFKETMGFFGLEVGEPRLGEF